MFWENKRNIYKFIGNTKEKKLKQKNKLFCKFILTYQRPPLNLKTKCKVDSF